MTDGCIIADYSGYRVAVQPFIITLLLVAVLPTSSEAGSSTIEYANLDCSLSAGNGIVLHQFQINSSILVSSSTPCQDSVLESVISLHCTDPGPNCQLLLPMECGSFANSGFYQCNTFSSNMLIKDGNVYSTSMPYTLSASTLYDGNGPIVQFDYEMITSQIVTYELPGYTQNVSFCASGQCLLSEGIFNFGDYFLSSLPASCVCETFSCCTHQFAKRSINSCTYSTNSISCSTGNCTTILINGTLDNVECSTWSWSDIRMVCQGGICYPSPLQSSSTTPSILSPAAFWSLLALSIVLFLACGGLVVFIANSIFCRRASLM